MRKEKITAIVLAGGSGTRMGGTCKKQYMLLDGKPILYYSLKTFQESRVDEIILVTNEEEYCRQEIIEKYHLNKVKKITAGGAERYHSVFCGLQAAEYCDYVLIHDGARPFVTEDMIERSIHAVKKYQACAVGMPVKDTIKIADSKNYAAETPDRKSVWMIQTPQTFSYSLILEAYRQILKEQPEGITDDAMVIEHQKTAKVKLIPGSYENIKITTPEDMEIAKSFRKYKRQLKDEKFYQKNKLRAAKIFIKNKLKKM